ncbi:MAG: hypothetical protein ACI4MQ_02125 [Candidatus Coproplasma sp.]
MIKLKKFLTAFICVILSLICAFGVAFSGCAEYKPPEDNGGNTPVVPDDPDDPEEPVDENVNDFSVQLVVKNNKTWQNFTYDYYEASDNRGGAHEQGWIKWDSIRIQWTNVETNARHYAALNSDGKAVCPGLDGDYKVTIFNVPTGFTYEPNVNYADNISKKIEIIVYKIQTYSSIQTLHNVSDHSIMYEVHVVKNTGVYRAVLENKDDKVMYAFQTNKQGTYSLTSLVDVTENKINPKLTVYSGILGNYVTNALASKDDGGSENSYTKNIYWEYKISANETKGSNALFFELYSTSVDGNASYPLTVDFLIQRDGDFTRQEYDTSPVKVTEDFTKTPPTPEGTATEAADSPNTGTKWCDSSAVILNSESGILSFKSKNNVYGSKFVRREELTDQIILNTAEGIAGFKENYLQRFSDKDGVDVIVNTDGVTANDGNYYYYSYSYAEGELRDEFNEVIGKTKTYTFTLTDKYSFEILMNTAEGIEEFKTKVNNQDAKVVRKEILNHEVVLNTPQGIASFRQAVGENATVSWGNVPRNDGNYYYVVYDETGDTYTMTEKFEVYDGQNRYFTYNASTDTYVVGERYYSTDGYYYFYEYEEATDTYILTDRLYAVIDAAVNSLVNLTDTNINYRFLNGKNYFEFINTYRAYCNSDGAYPVNEELAQMLKNYCLSTNMFNDGYGQAESAGYNADEDGMWLLACKYYAK